MASGAANFPSTTHTPDLDLATLIKTLKSQIKRLAQANNLSIPKNPAQTGTGPHRQHLAGPAPAVVGYCPRRL